MASEPRAVRARRDLCPEGRHRAGTRSWSDSVASISTPTWSVFVGLMGWSTGVSSSPLASTTDMSPSGSLERHPLTPSSVRRSNGFRLPASSISGNRSTPRQGPSCSTRSSRKDTGRAGRDLHLPVRVLLSRMTRRDDHRSHDSFGRAYAVHHWGHSWKGGKGVKVRPLDLLPKRGEVKLPFIAATWREGMERVTE